MRAYQFRLKPTSAQEQSLEKLLAAACRLHNDALRERKETWEKEKKTVRYLDQALKLKEKRQKDPELALLNFSACQQVLRRLDKAFQRFFRAIQTGQKAGYPRFKKAHHFRTLEFTYGDGVKLLGKALRVQNVGVVRVRFHRPLPEGKIKRVYLTRKADGWYATFLVEVDPDTLKKPLPQTGQAVGIDVGIENLLTLSSGVFVPNPRWYQKTEERIAQAQRILSEKKKGSKRWKRLCRRIARLFLHLQRQREDFYWKLAWQLCRRFDLLCVEDLNAQGLARSRLSKQALDAS